MALSKPESADIVSVVKETFSGAGAFLPARADHSDMIIGWTFRVRLSLGRTRYGWATTEGFVFTDLCSSRTQADEIMRRVVRDEQVRSKSQ